MFWRSLCFCLTVYRFDYKPKKVKVEFDKKAKKRKYEYGDDEDEEVRSFVQKPRIQQSWGNVGNNWPFHETILIATC